MNRPLNVLRCLAIVLIILAMVPACSNVTSSDATPTGALSVSTPTESSTATSDSPMKAVGVTPGSGAGDFTKPKTVLATTTFLADIAQNVAGDRIKVSALMPIGVDPHNFEATPSDAAKISACDLLIINGSGFEAPFERLFADKVVKGQIIDASAGLENRVAKEGEAVEQSAHDDQHADQASEQQHQHEGDPHFWLDPIKVIEYVEHIRSGLSQADPSNSAIYQANAQAYITRLRDLDQAIAARVSQIPIERRQIVTNHESLGYFADRYGFKIIGAVFPSVSSDASPSAQQLARLVESIKATGARAIFLETGANSQLAQQVAQETGIKVVVHIYTHSITEQNGEAPTYIDMMNYNANTIVDALR